MSKCVAALQENETRCEYLKSVREKLTIDLQQEINRLQNQLREATSYSHECAEKDRLITELKQEIQEYY